MTTAVRHRVDDQFEIHEDARTEETEMMVEDVDPATMEAEEVPVEEEAEGEAEEEEEEPEEEEESSEEEGVDGGVKADMDKLQADFPGFRNKYRLIKRIGEGMSVFFFFPILL